MSTADAPLTPRRAGRAIAAGAPRVSVELAVDPPSLGPAKAVKGGDAGLKHVVEGLNTRASDAPRLELAFAGGRARPHHVRMLADGVSRGEQPPVSVALDLSDTDVLHYDIAGYPPKWPLLFANTSLRVVGLDVSGCSVEDAPPPRLFLEALGACEHLESLGLRHMGSALEKAEEREEFADTVAWLARRLPRLASLDATHCDAGELRLAERLVGDGGDGEGLPSLQTLRLAWNGLQSAAFLRSLPNLHTLHLGRNDLGATGAEALAAYARGNARLRVLELNDCELGPAGCCAVLGALGEAEEGGLQHLGLHGNDGGDAAAEAAARLLAARRGSLECLDLSSNGCTNVGLAHLAAVVAADDGGVPLALAELNLSDNAFEVGTAVLRIAAARPALDVNYYESLPADVRKALAQQRQAAGADDAAAAADAATLGPVAVDGVLLPSLAQAAAAALPQALRQLCEVRPAVAAALADGTLASADSAVAGAIAAVRAGGAGAAAASEGQGEKGTRKRRAGGGLQTLRIGARSTVDDVAAACGAAVTGTVRLVCEEAAMDRLCLLAEAAQLRLVSLDTSTRVGARVSLSAVVGLAQ